jgi:hypothetical protein
MLMDVLKKEKCGAPKKLFELGWIIKLFGTSGKKISVLKNLSGIDAKALDIYTGIRKKEKAGAAPAPASMRPQEF